MNKTINNFTGGEWSALLKGRADLDKYDSACLVAENCRVLPYGGIRNRAGSLLVARTKDGLPARLLQFNYSTTTSFVLELTNQAARFYSNGVQVTSGGSPYEISTPWAQADLWRLQYLQINDVAYFVHPSYPPHKLSRLADTNWTLEAVNWTYPPLLEENTSSTTLAVAAVTGTTTLTASADVFTAGHVGAFFELRHLRDADTVELDLSGTSGTTTSGSIRVQGNWTLFTTERWYGTLDIQRSEDEGATWRTVRRCKSSADYNASISGKQDEEALFRLVYSATGDPYGSSVWEGTAPTSYVHAKAKLGCEEAYSRGLVKVTGFTNARNVSVTVVQRVGATSATDIWSEGAFSTVRGYPRAVALFEQRLLFAGTASKPTRFWGSVTSDFENFDYGENDDAAIAYDMVASEQNAVNWMESSQRVLIGTAGAEFAASSGNSEEPLTPSNGAVRRQTVIGSENVQALAVNNVVFFVERYGVRIREMSFDIQQDSYVSPDVTLMAPHIGGQGVKEMDFARLPDPLLIAPLTTGVLGVMTYNREQNVMAWGRWTTAGQYASAAVVYGAATDEIWVSVNRPDPGTGAANYFVERFAAEQDAKTGVYLDFAVTGTATGSTIILPWWYVGRTVRVVIAGNLVGDFTAVSNVANTSSKVTLPGGSPTGTYVIGLAYTSEVETMPLETVLQDGSSKGRIRRVSEVVLSFVDTIGATVGTRRDQLEHVAFFNTGSDTLDNAPALFTGEKVVSALQGNNRGATLIVRQTWPYPFKLLSMSMKMEVTG